MSASEAAAVDRHLEICDPCRERSRVERAARTLVTDRASRLSALAPASLTARCEAAAASPFAKGRPRGRRLVASRRVLGAHRCRWRLRLSCSSPQRSRSCASADSPTRSWLQNSPGITPRASRWPETTDRRPTSRTWNSRSSGRSDGTRVSRLGCRRRGSNCSRLAVAPTTIGQMAHVLCRLDGQPMSLFVLPQGARPNEDLEIVGQRVIMWGTGDRTYALVGQQASPALQPCRLVHSHTIRSSCRSMDARVAQQRDSGTHFVPESW